MRSKPEAGSGSVAQAQSAGSAGLVGQSTLQPERETSTAEGCQATFTSVGGCSPGHIEGPVEFLPVGLEHAEEISEWMDYIHNKLFTEFMMPANMIPVHSGYDVTRLPRSPLTPGPPTRDPDFDWDW